MTEICAKDSKESQVGHQCKRLVELTAELHSRFQGLEQRLETALMPKGPSPQETEGKAAETLCPLAEILRAIADDLMGHATDVRTLADRIEI